MGEGGRGRRGEGREDGLFGSGLFTVSRGLSSFVDMFLMMSVFFFLRREIWALDLSWKRGGERGVFWLGRERKMFVFFWMVFRSGGFTWDGRREKKERRTGHEEGGSRRGFREKVIRNTKRGSGRRGFGGKGCPGEGEISPWEGRGSGEGERRSWSDMNSPEPPNRSAARDLACAEKRSTKPNRP